jgi:hypothetical protein
VIVELVKTQISEAIFRASSATSDAGFEVNLIKALAAARA